MTPSDYSIQTPICGTVRTPDDRLAAAIRLLEDFRPKWHADAACIESGLDFQSRNENTRAKCLQICGRCLVLTDCKAWSLDQVTDDVSILGGMDPAARKQARKAKP